MSVFLKLALPVTGVSLLFSIQNPTMIHQATIDLASKVMYLQPIIYEKVCAMSLHQFFQQVQLLSKYSHLKPRNKFLGILYTRFSFSSSFRHLLQTGLVLSTSLNSCTNKWQCSANNPITSLTQVLFDCNSSLVLSQIPLNEAFYLSYPGIDLDCGHSGMHFNCVFWVVTLCSKSALWLSMFLRQQVSPEHW
jgi:hypothetical protein